MVLDTGVSSVGELEITLRISLVAVWVLFGTGHRSRKSGILLGIRDVDGNAAAYGLAMGVLGVERLRIHRPLDDVAGWVGAGDGRKGDLVADDPGQSARIAL
jgi:hypothetical protein